MRILFLTSAHNSLSQRLWIELGERGHEIRICVAATGEAMIAAVSREAPDLIIAPMLKTAIPEEVWSRHLCLIVHPGIKGDRGPSSLDWAITNDEKIWGVTILEAADAFDAGAIWASHEFALEADPPAKSSLYRGQVTEAALRGVIEAVARIESGEFQSGSWQPQKLSDVSPQGSRTLRGCLRPPMRQADRAIDWMRDKTAMIVRKIRAADSAPGVLGTLLGKTCFLFGAHEEERLNGPPGKVLGRRDGAICIGTIDGAMWISHLKAKAEAQGVVSFAQGGTDRRDQTAGDAGLGTAASRRAQSTAADRRAGRLSHLPRDRLYRGGPGWLPFVRFLQWGDEHVPMHPAPRRVSPRPLAPDPGHRAAGWRRFLVERHRSQCDRGLRRSGRGIRGGTSMRSTI